MPVTVTQVSAPHGRYLHVLDARSLAGSHALPVFWHHSTPGTGEPPEPLLDLAGELDLAWVGYARPGYLSSTSQPGRSVAHAADDVSTIADALGIDRFAVIGYSSGGPHALACAARLPDRVAAAAVIASPAPRDGVEFDWYAGMVDSASLLFRAAEQGDEARRTAEREGFDPEFTSRDGEALEGRWSWLAHQGATFTDDDLDGAVHDDIALVRAWDFDVDVITAPVLVAHGQVDRLVPAAHGQWLADRLAARLWLREGHGHVSVLGAAPETLHWLHEQV